MRGLVLLLIGCGGTGDTQPQDSAEATVATSSGTTVATGSVPTGTTSSPYTTTWACRDDVDPGLLNGSYPEVELPLVPFTALNRDLTERNETHLQGQITVLWFYPAAGTFG
jgi:hypothetical protein